MIAYADGLEHPSTESFVRQRWGVGKRALRQISPMGDPGRYRRWAVGGGKKVHLFREPSVPPVSNIPKKITEAGSELIKNEPTDTETQKEQRGVTKS